MQSKTIAIMQPYLFPYIGYFQLIKAVDVFVFYDDVNFIKKGWVNRNQIIINKQPTLFSVPLKKASQNKLINEVRIDLDDNWLKTFNKSITYNYKKAPYYEQTFELIQNVFNSKSSSISDLAIESIVSVIKFLEVETQFKISSECFSDSKELVKEKRLINIIKKCSSSDYINAIGGKCLYEKSDFLKEDVQLKFLKSKSPIQYKQFSNEFFPNLSILDILMFNSKEDIRKMLNNYQLV